MKFNLCDKSGLIVETCFNALMPLMYDESIVRKGIEKQRSFTQSKFLCLDLFR